MAFNIKQRIPINEFRAFIASPENTDKCYELISGEIVEKMPSNLVSSHIASRINRYFDVFVEANKLGFVTGENGGYQVLDEVYAPDVGFLSNKRQPKLYEEGFNPIPPDLAVEVVSPNDNEMLLSIKIANYLTAGTQVWVVYPKTKEVVVYIPGQAAQIFGINAVLDGGTVLPNFQLAVKDIFPE